LRIDKALSNRLNAGRLRIDDGAKPAQQAPLVLKGPPGRE